MDGKLCPKCNVVKPLTEKFFYFRKDSNDFRTNCIKCCNIKNKENRDKNKGYISTYKKEYYKKYPWKRTLLKIKERCGNQRDKNYPRYGGRGIKCKITEDELKFLWFRDNANLMEYPTIDRKENDGNYELSNCQYIEKSLNSKKDKYKQILQFDLAGNFIRQYDSLLEASKLTGINNKAISVAIRKRTGHSGGFIWRYK